LALTSHSWPGNIRELENTILRASAICQTAVIIPADLGIPSDGISTAPDVPGRSYQALKREAIATFDRNYLTGLMTEHRGNVTHAARTAGKDRRELGKLLKKYGVDPRFFRAA
jgi:DNA-binding NtrC family response regulator